MNSLKKYDLLIWDFDGTVADTSPGIVSSVTWALEQTGYEVPPAEVLKQFVGPPLTFAARELIHMKEQDMDRFVTLFRQDYTEHGIFDSAPFPGIPRVLEQLQNAGRINAIATLKPLFMAQLLLKRYGIEECFGFCAGGAANESGSITKSDMILQVIEELLPGGRKNAVMIGDTVYDYEGARAAGVDFIGVAWGEHLTNEDALRDGYVYFARSSEELLAALL